jgi:hypothetical protein
MKKNFRDKKYKKDFSYNHYINLEEDKEYSKQLKKSLKNI